MKTKAALEAAVDELISESTDLDPGDVAEVVVVDDEDELAEAVEDGKIAFLREQIAEAAGVTSKKPDAWRESHAAAVARLLEAHGLLKDLDRDNQTALIGGILKLFTIKG